MLEKTKKYIKKKSKSFDEVYVDYILSIQDKNILAEIEYIQRHNKLDVFKLDKLVENEIKVVMSR